MNNKDFYINIFILFLIIISIIFIDNQYYIINLTLISTKLFIEYGFKKIQLEFKYTPQQRLKYFLSIRNTVKSKLDRYSLTYSIGIIYYDLKNFKKAIEEFEEAKKFAVSEKNLGNALYWAGVSYYKNKDYNRAILNLKKVIECFESTESQEDSYIFYYTNYWLGMSYLEIEEYTKAQNYLISSLDTAVPYESSIYLSFYWAGMALFRDKKYELAIDRFTSAQQYLKNTEDIFDTSYWLGQAFYCLEKYEEALSHFSMSIKKMRKKKIPQDNLLLANFYLGQTYQKLEKYDKAIKQYNFTNTLNISENFNYYDLLYNLALTYFKANYKNKALEKLEETKKFAKTDVEFFQIYSLMGKLYFEEKEYKKALIEFNTASKYIKDINSSYFTFFKIGEIHYKLGNYLEAIKILTKTLKNTTEDSQAYSITTLLGLIHYRNQEYQKALKYFDDSILYAFGKAENFTPTLWLGRCYYKLKNFDKAVYYLKRGNNLADSDEERYLISYWLGETYYSLDNFETALNFLNKALQLKEKSCVYLALGLIHYKNNNFSMAQQYYKKGLKLAENDEERFISNRYLGLILHAQNKIEEAIPFFKNALDLDKRENKSSSLHSLGVIYYYKKKYDIAKHYLNEALNFYSKKNEGYDSLYCLAMCYYEEKNLDEALSNFLPLVNIPNSSEVFLYYYLANIYYQKKIKEKALYYIEKSLTLDNNDKDSHKLKEKILKI